jgi:hypothetical protein
VVEVDGKGADLKIGHYTHSQEWLCQGNKNADVKMRYYAWRVRKAVRQRWAVSSSG